MQLTSVLLAAVLAAPSPAPARSDDPAGPLHPDLEPLTERWRGAMEACGVSALAVVLVEGDEVVHRVTLGRRDPGRDAPVTPDTIFYIASATKPYVAFALAQLAERGKVDLAAPVKQYLPRFQLADPELTASLTVEDLLCHRYGLNSTPIVFLDAYTGEITEDRFYHFLADVESPGELSYSNLHFTLAGRVVEAVSGQLWREYLAEHVFGPAGMTRTTGHADWMYAQDDVAFPAERVDGELVRAGVRKTDRTMHAAGGLGTSIDDFARWIRLQLGRGEIDGVRLLSEEALEDTWRLRAGSPGASGLGTGDAFALGWQHDTYRGHLQLGHGGGYVGSASYVCFLPELGLGLAVLATGSPGAGGLASVVSDDVRERLLADDEIQDGLPRLLERVAEREDQPAASEQAAARPAAALALAPAAVAGVYRDPWLGTITLALEDGALRGTLGGLRAELRPTGATSFVLDVTGLSELEGVLEVEGGKVTALRMELGGVAGRFERGE